MGVSDRGGSLFFTKEKGCMNHATIVDDASVDTVEVEVTSIDDTLDHRVPELMKIDVEGLELAVLSGAKKTLRSPKLYSIILELNGSGERYGNSDREIGSVLTSYGFRACEYNPLTRSLHACKDLNSGSGNIIFVRNVDFVRRRLRDAPAFSVSGRTL